MSVAAFLSELRDRDIRVWLEGETLRCNAPAGTLTGELREKLQQRRNDIVRFLHLADAMAAQRGALVPLQPHGGRTPVFGVPGAGDVFCFRALAQALGGERPFFGLQPPGLDGASEPLSRVEDLAAYFAREIRACRPEGPWIIAGKCIGGAVAFELARQLLGEGKSGFLALFGAPHPTYFRPLSHLRHRIEHRARLWPERLRILAAQTPRERLEYVAERLRRYREAPDAVLLTRARVHSALVRAVRAYEPGFFPGRVHQFLPCGAWAARSRAKRWLSIAAAVETHCGPDGCTEDDMLLSGYAPVFAEQFAATCAREGL